MLFGITLILLGLVAVPSLVLAKKPNAKELFDKVAPYQGWAGVVFCIWGIWGIIDCILTIGWLGNGLVWVIAWILWLLVAVTETVLGFILGYGLIQKYALSKNEKAAAKGEEVLKKLMPLQGTFGVLAIILGLVYIVFTIIAL